MRGTGGQATDHVLTLPQDPLFAPDGLQASEPCQDRIGECLGYHTGAHAKPSVRAATPSAGSVLKLG